MEFNDQGTDAEAANSSCKRFYRIGGPEALGDVVSGPEVGR